MCIEDDGDDSYGWAVVGRRALLAIEDESFRLRRENAELRRRAAELDRDNQDLMMQLHQLWWVRRYIGIPK